MWYNCNQGKVVGPGLHAGPKLRGGTDGTGTDDGTGTMCRTSPTCGTAEKIKQIPKPNSSSWGPLAPPWSLRVPRCWSCCWLSMGLHWWVLVCGAVLGVAGEWGWDPLAIPLGFPTGCTGERGGDTHIWVWEGEGCPLVLPGAGSQCPPGLHGPGPRTFLKWLLCSGVWGRGTCQGLPLSPSPSRSVRTWFGVEG